MKRLSLDGGKTFVPPTRANAAVITDLWEDVICPSMDEEAASTVAASTDFFGDQEGDLYDFPTYELCFLRAYLALAKEDLIIDADDPEFFETVWFDYFDEDGQWHLDCRTERKKSR